jgi:hypothetical protein
MRFLRVIRAWFHREEEATMLREEMEFHRELRARKLRSAGLTVSEADFSSRRLFGNAGSYQDQISDLWGHTMWERFFQDLRQGARALAKAPGFTAIAR